METYDGIDELLRRFANKIKIFTKNEVIPLLVFDGDKLKAKEATAQKRRE